MREETYRAALARIVEALHRESAAAWFGTGQVSSSDGQHFYLGGEGETGGIVNARYGRDPIIKLYTHISDRYAPFHVKVITSTSGEAIHVLDGLVNHDSAIDILANDDNDERVYGDAPGERRRGPSCAALQRPACAI